MNCRTFAERDGMELLKIAFAARTVVVLEPEVFLLCGPNVSFLL